MVNISCTVTDTAYPPSITLSYDPFGPSNPDVESILTNTSTYRTTMVYNNETETYTTTIVSQPITVNRYLNFRLIFCNVMVNSSTDFRGKRFTVFCKWLLTMYRTCRILFHFYSKRILRQFVFLWVIKPASVHVSYKDFAEGLGGLYT